MLAFDDIQAGSDLLVQLEVSRSGQQWLTFAAVLAHFLVQLGIALRVIMSRRGTGESLAWLMVVFGLPIAGPIFYLMLGELRLGSRRAARQAELAKPVLRWLSELSDRNDVDWSQLDEDSEPLARLCQRTIGVPALPGNEVELVPTWERSFAQLLADIERSQSTCHFEFYIWHVGGKADEVAAALMAAARRGVVCRVLVDSMGSREFLRSDQAEQMRAAGVQIADALPGGLWRLPFVRFDLRLHRKIVVIDGRVGYMGSLNLVDPRYFKKDAGVGQWVDAMVRIEGPAVEALQGTFLIDWYLETNTSLDSLRPTADVTPQEPAGRCAIQVLPSGPDLPRGAVEQVLLAAIYSADRELLLTSPYFIPSEPLLLALIGAARRGVEVTLIVPRIVDSRLVQYASAAFLGDLLEAGVRIAQFNEGLLHTKSVTVDGDHCLFGSVNLDPRSFRLNFEILLAIYNEEFTGRLRKLQQAYIDRSDMLDLATHRTRPRFRRLAENAARLVGPLL